MAAEGARRLRPLADADLPAIFELQRDPDAVAMARVPARDREAFDANWATIRGDDATTVRVVDDGAGGVAGWVLAFPHDGELRLGYWIAREHWGRGLATRAVRAFLAEVPARPLHATVATDNVASRRVLEKCGFTDLGPTTEWDDRARRGRRHPPLRAALRGGNGEVALPPRRWSWRSGCRYFGRTIGPAFGPVSADCGSP